MGDTTSGVWEQQGKGPVGFQVPDKQLLVNQSDIVVVEKGEKTTVVTDVAVLADSNIRKEEKIEKYQMLKAQLEKVKSKVVTGALRAERVVPTDL